MTMKIETVNFRRCTARMKFEALGAMLTDWAMAQSGFCRDATSVSVSFSFDADTGEVTGVDIQMTEDQNKLPKVQP